MSGPQNKWLTANEAASRLRVHPKTLYRLIRQGKVPAYRMGARGEWRLRVEDLDAAFKRYEAPRMVSWASLEPEFAGSAKEG